MLVDSSRALLATIRRFVDDEVLPVAAALEHADQYPHQLVDRMRLLGLFGALVPTTWGGLGLDATTYASLIEELCRGWMSLAGVLNSHTMAALIVLHHGTDEQRRRWLPRLARGEGRGGLGLTEPQAGSDVQAIRASARRQGTEYVLNGTKMFVTNGREGNTFALLAVTDPTARPSHRGMSCFIVEKGHPGLRVAQSIAKLGYKGVDTAELVFEDFPVPATNLVGGAEGRGFKHVMSGLEMGRINIAARAVGVGQAAMDAALRHVRATGGEPPAALADMAAGLHAARRLTYWAAGMKDRGERCDLEAGMAKLGASETAHRLATQSLQVHGERGALVSATVERLYRDTPLMLIGEGTNEIQRLLIARQLLERYGERAGARLSPESGRHGGAAEGTPTTSPAPVAPDEQRQAVLMVRQFVDKEIAPRAPGLDRAGQYPAELVTALAELGLLGALVPSELGGLGLDLPTYVMLVEELARGWSTIAVAVASHVTTTAAITRFGAHEPRGLLVPRLTRGEAVGALAMGGDVIARRDRDTCILRGSTALVDNAGRATLFLARAIVDPAGSAYLLVGRETPGLTLGPSEDALGGRGLDPARLVFDDCPVPMSAVLEDADGVAAVDWIGGLVRLGLAATAVGVAQAAFEAALRYSQQRTAFGVPICQHQAIQLKLADMATAVTAARLLTDHAAEQLELGDAQLAGLARVHASQAALDVTLEAMRVHGGYGYTAEFAVERYYRDAARIAVALGDPEGERRALARKLVKT